jgi:hypothetical protein
MYSSFQICNVYMKMLEKFCAYWKGSFFGESILYIHYIYSTEKNKEMNITFFGNNPRLADTYLQVSEYLPQVSEYSPRSAERCPRSAERCPRVTERRPQVTERRPQVAERRTRGAERRTQNKEYLPESSKNRMELYKLKLNKLVIKIF